MNLHYLLICQKFVYLNTKATNNQAGFFHNLILIFFSGLNVRAFVRDPSRLPDHLRNSVEVVKGDILDYNSVLNAVKNVTGVVVAIGTRNDLSPTTDLSEGLKNIVKAMKEVNVEIISVCLSAFLFYEPDKIPPRFHNLNADHQRMLDVLKATDLKYIACFPPHIAGMVFSVLIVQTYYLLFK